MSASSGPGDRLLHCFRELHEVIQKKQGNGELKGLDVRCRMDFLAPRARSWLIDLSDSGKDAVEELRAGDLGSVEPNLTMTYESEDVFLALRHKRLNPRVAVATGKLRLKGDISKLRSLQAVFEAAEAEASSSSSSSSSSSVSGAEAGVQLTPVSRERWEPDGPCCKLCETRFTVTLRRHHCRYCGTLTCKDCSRFSLRGKRACALCFLKQRSLWAARAAEDGGGGTTKAAGVGGEEGGEGDGMRDRVVTLEAKLRALERARHERKGRALLRFADVLVASVHVSFLLAGLLLSHHTATLICARLGLPALAYQQLVASPAYHYLATALPPAAFQSVSQAASQLLLLHSYWLVLAGCFVLLAHFMSGRRYRRSVLAFSIATVLVMTLKLAQAKARRTLLKGGVEALWDHTNSYCAAYLRLAFFRLGGMYLKLGQYVSSRADMVPEAYTEELASLQDAVPPSPLALVAPTIEAALGGRLSVLFEAFSGEALASASIAQVHRARIKGKGDVVVKVQHPGIAELLSIDLSNIVHIFRTVAWLEPAYDFSIIAEEWSYEVSKELDFRTEGDNISRAYEGFRLSGLDVDVPQLVSASPSVLVMTFCEGVKVTDPRAFPGGAADRAAYMTAVCEAFAHGMYVQGFFNGDPHPGNLLVQTVSGPPPPTNGSSSSKGSSGEVAKKKGEQQQQQQRRVRPVLLDWGLAKALPEHVRVGNCKIVYCAWLLDIAGMLNGMVECGFDVSKIDILQDLKNVRFLMRDTAPPAESRAQNERFIEDFMANNNAKPKHERNPLRGVVPDLLFLARVTELLQGLAAKLGTRVEYMDIMARFCRQAILEDAQRRGMQHPTSTRQLLLMQPASATPRSGPGAAPLSFLDRKVQGLLQRLVSEGHCLGSQVVLIKHGRVLVNSVAGVQGHMDPRPVQLSTLFPGHSLCKLVLAVLSHSLVEDGLLSYDTPLARYWPTADSDGASSTTAKGKQQAGGGAAAPAALAGVTLRHVLSHTSGLQYLFPPKATPQSLCSPQAGAAALLAASQPVTPPGARPSFHHFSFGWLLVPVLEAVSGRSLEQLVRERISGPLAIDNEFLLGPLPADMRPGGSDSGRLASVDYDLRSTVSVDELSQSVSEDETPPLLKLLDMLPPSDDERDERALRELLGTTLAGREVLLDPRMLNYYSLSLEHGLPGLNGRFTARALAEFLESLCRAERAATSAASPTAQTTASAASNSSRAVSDARRITGSSPRSMMMQQQGGSGSEGPVVLPAVRVRELRQAQRSGGRDEEPRFTRLLGRDASIRLAMGAQTFGFKRPARQQQPGEGSAATVVRYSAYGHASACGQLALCEPSSGLVLVVTSNRAPTPSQKSVGQEVLGLIAEELQMGQPLPIW